MHTPRSMFKLVWTVWLLVALFPEVPQAVADEPERQTVRLTIDYADGVRKQFTSLKWHKEMTILDALKAAQKHGRGINFEYRGSGSIALLTRIDDLKNEGGRGNNWIYSVNNDLGDRSFAMKKLAPSDHVLWKFGSYE